LGVTSHQVVTCVVGRRRCGGFVLGGDVGGGVVVLGCDGRRVDVVERVWTWIDLPS
jgi:hypothetical protein